MPNSWKWKTTLTLLSILFAIYILVPSLFFFRDRLTKSGSQGETQSPFSKFFPEKSINLGLDLRGGMYLEMDVDLDSALENRIDILLLEIERLVEQQKIDGIKLNRVYGKKLVTGTVTAGSRKEFLNLLTQYFEDVFQEVNPEVVADGEIALKLTTTYASYMMEMTLKQAEEAVRNRIDRFGLVEASIRRQGASRLVIEIPGVEDPDRVIDIIRKTGLLEFKLIDESIDSTALRSMIQGEAQGLSDQLSKDHLEEINLALQGKIPEDSIVLYEVERDTVTRETVGGIPYLVKRRTDVTGDMLRNAQVGILNNEPHVRISFNKIGAKNFGQITKENVGKRLAIVLDGVVTSAPVIEEPILNGEAQITLGYGSYQTLLKEAEDLSLLLREGALPAALTIATKTVIGPSLGTDSIRQGMLSLMIAAVVIVLFMVVYYKLGGLLATFSLIINVIYIFAILSMFQASLTLPGMAGIILTMGMAVDANIIIFERMREEARLGKSARSVIESGYSHAMSAIIDANITTLISGIVLYQFGTGPIKGFATTLVIGIVTTLFTAIVITRLVYDYFIRVRKIERVIL